MNDKEQKLRGKYLYGDVDLFGIRNRNEIRVIKIMAEILADYPDYDPQTLDVEDIYALALNNLPARYVQKGSIVLKEPVTEQDLEEAVRNAVETVRERPNHP